MKKIIIIFDTLIISSLFFAQNLSQVKNLTGQTKIDFKSEILKNEEKSTSTVVLPNVQIALSNPDYMVTAGDIYTLSYAAGSSAVVYNIVVDSSYRIKVSNLAVLDVAGKSYVTVKKQVEEIVQKNYPLSGAQFILTTPASFKVTVVGEVEETTEQTAWALTRLSTVVQDLLTDYSSTRLITVESASGKTKTYDLFKAQRDGDLSNNPYVRPGDIIKVNRYERLVTVAGGVERPGTYELLKGENLKDLIKYYGNGLAPMADATRIELTRNVTENSDYGEKLYLTQDSIDKNYELKNLDQVYVSTYTQLKPVMFIEGAILAKEDGTLEASDRKIVNFEDNTNYAYFVREYSEWFNNSTADLENAYILRKQQVIPLNISTILYDASYYSEEIVQAYDKLVVPFKQLFVTVAGAVRNPGRFPYIPDRSADYYIGLAGGFDMTKNTGGTINIVDINGKKIKRDSNIEPEYTITAKTNAFTYYFNQYAGVVTTIVSLLTSYFTIRAYLKS